MTIPLGLSNNDNATEYDSSFVSLVSNMIQNVISRVENVTSETNNGIDTQVATSVTQAVENIITIRIALIQTIIHFIT